MFTIFFVGVFNCEPEEPFLNGITVGIIYNLGGNNWIEVVVPCDEWLGDLVNYRDLQKLVSVIVKQHIVPIIIYY